jgi:hypothetical protein
MTPSPSPWPAAFIDAVIVILIGVMMILKTIPAEGGMPIIGLIVGARMRGMLPNGGGGGGGGGGDGGGAGSYSPPAASAPKADQPSALQRVVAHAQGSAVLTLLVMLLGLHRSHAVHA